MHLQTNLSFKPISIGGLLFVGLASLFLLNSITEKKTIVTQPTEHETTISQNISSRSIIVLLFGEASHHSMERPLCRRINAKMSDKERETRVTERVIESQVSNLLNPLAHAGFEVRVLLATNPCGHGWAKRLRNAYKPYLYDLYLDDCLKFPERRCHAFVSDTYFNCV